VAQFGAIPPMYPQQHQLEHRITLNDG
jgi:hypothetical protein